MAKETEQTSEARYNELLAEYATLDIVVRGALGDYFTLPAAEKAKISARLRGDLGRFDDMRDNIRDLAKDQRIPDPFQGEARPSERLQELLAGC